MPTVDLHTHIVVPDAVRKMNAAHPGHAATLTEEDGAWTIRIPGQAPMSPVPHGMFDTRVRLADMDRRRVDLQLLSVPPPQFFYQAPPQVGRDFAVIQNDAMLELSQQHPERLHVLATLPLQDPLAAVEEIQRLEEHRRVRGVEIGTNVAGTPLDAVELEPVWAALEDANLPVWLHPDQRTIAGAERLAAYYLQNLIGNPLESTIAIATLIFGGVLRRHPRLRFGFVHGGGFAPYQIGRWDHGWRHRKEPRALVDDRPPSDYLRQMFFDSLTHDGPALELLAKRVGWDQIVVGSDYPFDMAADDPVGAVEALGLAPEILEKVLAGNAERLLRPIAPPGSS